MLLLSDFGCWTRGQSSGDAKAVISQHLKKGLAAPPAARAALLNSLLNSHRCQPWESFASLKEINRQCRKWTLLLHLCSGCAPQSPMWQCCYLSLIPLPKAEGICFVLFVHRLFSRELLLASEIEAAPEFMRHGAKQSIQGKRVHEAKSRSPQRNSLSGWSKRNKKRSYPFHVWVVFYVCQWDSPIFFHGKYWEKPNWNMIIYSSN